MKFRPEQVTSQNRARTIIVLSRATILYASGAWSDYSAWPSLMVGGRGKDEKKTVAGASSCAAVNPHRRTDGSLVSRVTTRRSFAPRQHCTGTTVRRTSVVATAICGCVVVGFGSLARSVSVSVFVCVFLMACSSLSVCVRTQPTIVPMPAYINSWAIGDNAK